MINSTKFQLPTLQYAAKNEILKPITLFYLIRAKYKYPVIYNYSPNRLKKVVDLHWKTIDKYVKKLINHKFAEMRGKHLVLLNPHKGFSTTIETRPYTSFKGIGHRIEFLMIKNNLLQQQFQIAVNYGMGYTKLNSVQKNKAVRKFKGRTPELESSISPTITCSSIARLFNVTRQTANKKIHELVYKNYITTKNRIVRKGKCSSLGNLIPGRYFIKNGYLYKHCGRVVSVGNYLAVKGVSAI